MDFDLETWRHRFQHNAEEAERNASMDSGWSLSTAQQCEQTALNLYRELVECLAQTSNTPADFFDRPKLVQLCEAARFTTMWFQRIDAKIGSESQSQGLRREQAEDEL